MQERFNQKNIKGKIKCRIFGKSLASNNKIIMCKNNILEKINLVIGKLTKIEYVRRVLTLYFRNSLMPRFCVIIVLNSNVLRQVFF